MYSTKKQKKESKKFSFITSIVLATILLSLPIAGKASGSKTEFPTDTIFRFVDKMPEFPGGVSALMEYIAENMRYPAEIQHTGWRGRVVVQFVVRKTGEISDVRPFHEVFPPLDEEAVRVVQSMPNWIPGEHNGEKVNVEFILPININVIPIENENIAKDVPQFPGGDDALLEYLLENIQYSFESDKRGTPQGRLIVQFNVSKSGKISDIEIVNGISPKLDKEVMRVIEAMPDWIPAEKEGEKVDAQFRLPINFLVVWLNMPPPRNFENSDFFPAEQQPDDFIFPITERAPEFPGGMFALMQFLSSNIQYPANARRIGMQGQVVVSFVVGIDGKIDDVQVVETTLVHLDAITGNRVAARQSLEREAIRVVSRMPNWIPGEQLGEKRKVRFNLPITFRLQ